MALILWTRSQRDKFCLYDAFQWHLLGTWGALQLISLPIDVARIASNEDRFYCWDRHGLRELAWRELFLVQINPFPMFHVSGAIKKESFEVVLKTAVIQNTIFWIVSQYSLVGGYKRFRGICCLHFQVLRISQAWKQVAGDMFLRNVGWLFDGLHGVIYHKIKSLSLNRFSWNVIFWYGLSCTRVVKSGQHWRPETHTRFCTHLECNSVNISRNKNKNVSDTI
jgi:hypothetical protein